MRINFHKHLMSLSWDEQGSLGSRDAAGDFLNTEEHILMPAILFSGFQDFSAAFQGEKGTFIILH